MVKKALRLFVYFLLICLAVALLNFKTTLSYILNYESYRELNQGNGLKEVRNSLFLYVFDEEMEYDQEASFGTSLEAPLTEEDKDRIQEILSRIRHSWLIPPQKVPTAKNDRCVYIEYPDIYLYPTHYEMGYLCATCPGYREIFEDINLLAKEIRDRYADVPRTS